MSETLNLAINSVNKAIISWCRYITGNDTGATGSHQAGFYVPKAASRILFANPCKRGENREKKVTIKWQNDFSTNSCMKYYGVRSRNEFRITRFGKGFPFLEDDCVGSLLILSKYSENYYEAYVLSEDVDIDSFLAYYGILPDTSGQVIEPTLTYPENQLANLIKEFVSRYDAFPSTRTMSEGARNCYNQVNRISQASIVLHPDDILLGWMSTEYSLFKEMETKIYSHVLQEGFNSIDALVTNANEVLNRRKSRAGKSLEHHLAEIFTCNSLLFEEQAVTENNKRPDFLFPDSESYHNICFPADNLVVLGAKTTCKDRWRQVLTEADRINKKHLFTLQQGVSHNQLKEMQDSNLQLVVPQKYISTFPKEYQSEILSLSKFIAAVKEKQSTHKYRK